MRYRLSKFIPVRFRSTYWRMHHCPATGDYHRIGRHKSTWWQWRDRLYRVRTVVL